MSYRNKKLKVSYPYPLGYPIKVVIRNFNIRVLLGWLFQKYAFKVEPGEILISERIVELPLLHQWLGQGSVELKGSVLEIGHVASSASLELASLGYVVTGIDLRDYPFVHTNLTSITDDFLKHDFRKTFDFIYSLSAIEHFGFSHRYDGKKDVDNNMDEDVFLKISKLLKFQGRAVVSVPYARLLSPSVWFRIYTREELNRKLDQHFHILEQRFYGRVNGEWNEVLQHSNDPESARDGVAIFLLSKKN
jgi:hypothetical protein